ncbi:252_t:CDS:2, partial [Dentiscutata erythropus]
YRGASKTSSSTTGSSNSTTSSNIPAPNFTFPTNAQNISTANDPEFIRRFQQLMQPANIRALLATGGDVNSAIEFLLAHRS